MTTPRTIRIAFAATSVLLAACGVGEARETGGGPVLQRVPPVEPVEPEIADEADAPLRAMSNYLAGLEAFSVHTEGSIEVVLADGQKLAFPYAGNVRIRRPDRLRSDRVGDGNDRVGEGNDLHFYYDGSTFTLYDEQANVYAQRPAPPTVYEAIDAARRDLDIEAPGADLLHDDPYAALTEDVVSGSRVGAATIDGVRCHHLAFRGNEVDWQIWIEDGPRPLPRRFIITSKQMEGAPQFVVEFSAWNTEATIADEVFEFTRPQGAQRIEFLPVGATPTPIVTDVPASCTRQADASFSCEGEIYRPYYQGTTLVYTPGRVVPQAPEGQSK